MVYSKAGVMLSGSLLSLSSLALGLAAVSQAHDHYINYTTVTGFFLQDEPSTNASTFLYNETNFGLIDRPYDSDCEFDPNHTKSQWQRFAHQIEVLNEKAGKDVQYKLLFMGRHGEGYHNAAESYYGTPAWNCYWSLRDGNSTTTWADAHLTPNGIRQAMIANAFWAHEIATQKIPLPQSYYTSPLSRCLETANITFSALQLPEHAAPFIPTVKELFRESISGHTCDRRMNKTAIHDAFPEYRIEHGFSEQDLLWHPLVGETSIDQQIRSKQVLDDVFSHDDSVYISITSHSGEIGAILEVIGHQTFGLSTGAVIPALVRAETIKGKPTTTATQPYTSISPLCSTPPPLPTPTAA